MLNTYNVYDALFVYDIEYYTDNRAVLHVGNIHGYYYLVSLYPLKSLTPKLSAVGCAKVDGAHARNRAANIPKVRPAAKPSFFLYTYVLSPPVFTKPLASSFLNESVLKILTSGSYINPFLQALLDNYTGQT